MGEAETGVVNMSTLYDINYDMLGRFVRTNASGTVSPQLNEASDSNSFHYSSLVDMAHIFERMVTVMEL